MTTNPIRTLTRWVVPTPKVLEQIRQDRLEQKRQQSGSEVPADPDVNLPAYVRVTKNEFFKGKLDLIVKSRYNLSAEGIRNSPALEGFVPKPFKDGQPHICVIYWISDTAAAKYGISLQKRTRYRKQKTKNPTGIPSTKEIEIIDVDMDCSPPPPPRPEPTRKNVFVSPSFSLPSSSKKSQPKHSTPNHRSSTQDRKMTTISLISNIDSSSSSVEEMGCEISPSLDIEWNGTPYNPATIFQSIKVMYNICSSAKLFPKDSLLNIHANENSKEKENKCALNLQLYILKLEDFGNSYVTPIKQLETIIAQGKLNKLTKILEKIIIFHVRKPFISRLMHTYTTQSVKTGRKPRRKQKSTRPKHEYPARDETRLNHSVEEEKTKIKNVLKQQVKLPHVIGGISTMMRLSGCTALLGSNSNRRAFLKFLKRFLMAGIKAQLPLGQLMNTLNIDHCTWLEDVKNPNLRTHIFAKIVYWMFSDYILSLLRCGFYITEMAATRSQMIFFLQKSWSVLFKSARQDLIKNLRVEKIPYSKSQILRQTIQPTSGIRFIPKKDNFRTILRLKTKVSTNQKNEIGAVLRYWARLIAPHATNNESRIRDRWLNFVTKWKNEGCPKLYFLRMDIRDAYPSVNFEILRKTIKDLVEMKKELHLKQMQNRTILNGREIYKRGILFVNDESTKVTVGQKLFKQYKVKSEEIMKRLFYYVKKYEIVKINSQYFKYFSGLPQGSTFSQALCNIYFGEVEKNILSDYLKKPSEFFLRSVDDYLFISSDPNRVFDLYSIMRDGIPKYNCFVKNKKTTSNIFVDSEKEIHHNEWIPFCGWRFNITNGHVSRDFSTYAGLDAISTMSFSMVGTETPEQFIHKRMGFLTPIRLSHLLLDRTFNCSFRIARSIFEGGMMMAFRFYAACRILYPSLGRIKGPEVATALCNAIGHFTNLLVKNIIQHWHRRRKIEPGNLVCVCSHKKKAASTPNPLLTEKEIRYIVYQAFLTKLRRHFEPKHELITKLEIMFSGLSTKLRPKSRYLFGFCKRIPRYMALTK